MRLSSAQPAISTELRQGPSERVVPGLVRSDLWADGTSGGPKTGDRLAKRTHFGELIGVENGPIVAVSGSFELFWFEASGAKDVDGGRLRTDQACSS